MLIMSIDYVVLHYDENTVNEYYDDDNIVTRQMQDEFIIRVILDRDIDDCEFVTLSQLADMYIKMHVLKQQYVKQKTAYDDFVACKDDVLVLIAEDDNAIYIENVKDATINEMRYDIPFTIRIPCDEEYLSVAYVELNVLCDMYREYIATLK